MGKTIKYKGKSYRIDLKENDDYKSGGIYDLSLAFASAICTVIDPANYRPFNVIQKEVYNLIKVGIVGELGKGAELC